MNLDAVRKCLLEFPEIEFVLDENAVRFNKQRKRLQDIQFIRHFEGHDGLRKIYQYHIEGPEIVLRQHQKAFRGIAEPPLDPVIVKVRLRSEVFEGAPYHFLIELEPDRKL